MARECVKISKDLPISLVFASFWEYPPTLTFHWASSLIFLLDAFPHAQHCLQASQPETTPKPIAAFPAFRPTHHSAILQAPADANGCLVRQQLFRISFSPLRLLARVFRHPAYRGEKDLAVV